VNRNPVGSDVPVLGCVLSLLPDYFGNKFGPTSGFVAFQGNGVTVNGELRVALNNRVRAQAAGAKHHVANTSNGQACILRLMFHLYDVTMVIGRVVEVNNAAIVPCKRHKKLAPIFWLYECRI